MMKTALLCALLVLLPAGCNVSAETEQAASISAASAAPLGTGQPENGNPPPKPANVLRSKETLRQAQAALAKLPELAGKPLNVYEKISFFNGTRPRIEIALEDPTKPHSVLQYLYENGRWQPDIAEDASADKQFARKLFPLSGIDFAQAADIAGQWQAKAESVNAVLSEPYAVSLVQLAPPRKLMWHTAQIDAVGARYYLSFHADGREWEFKKF